MVLRDISVNWIRRNELWDIGLLRCGCLVRFVSFINLRSKQESLPNRQTAEWWQITSSQRFLHWRIHSFHTRITILPLWESTSGTDPLSACRIEHQPLTRMHTHTPRFSFFTNDFRTSSVWHTLIYIFFKYSSFSLFIWTHAHTRLDRKHWLNIKSKWTKHTWISFRGTLQCFSLW